MYLTTNYFIDKPVDRLIGKNIKAEDINDDALGRALDAIFAVNPTALYSRLAHNACNKLGLTSKFRYLDSTSFHLEGKYNSDNSQVVSDSQETQVVKVTRGI